MSRSLSLIEGIAVFAILVTALTLYGGRLRRSFQRSKAVLAAATSGRIAEQGQGQALAQRRHWSAWVAVLAAILGNSLLVLTNSFIPGLIGMILLLFAVWILFRGLWRRRGK